MGRQAWKISKSEEDKVHRAYLKSVNSVKKDSMPASAYYFILKFYTKEINGRRNCEFGVMFNFIFAVKFFLFDKPVQSKKGLIKDSSSSRTTGLPNNVSRVTRAVYCIQ